MKGLLLQNLRWFLVVISFSFQGLFAQDSTQVTEVSEVEKIDIRVNIDSLGKAIVVNDDTLFSIYQSYGTTLVKDRAQLINNRLEDLLKVYEPETDTLILVIDNNVASVNFKSESILQITKAEAIQQNLSLEKLADFRFKKISNYFETNLSQRETIFQYLFSAAIIIVVLFIIFKILQFFTKHLNRWIDNKKSKKLKGIKIKDFEVMDAKDELELIHRGVLLLRIMLMLIIAYIVFPVIFSFFPATEFMAYALIDLVYIPLVNFGKSFIAYIPNLFTIIVIIVIVRYILKLLGNIAKKVQKGKIKIKGFYADWAHTTFDLIKVVIIALTFVMLFPYLPGAQSAVFKGVSVFIGVIFSIGSTSVVANVVAGLVLTYMRPFKIGDRIKIGDVEGEIVEKTAFILRIKTPKNEYITIPNSNVLNSHITNYNRSIEEGGVILFTDVTIGYNVPWRKVHELLLKAAENTEDIEKKPEPFVLQNNLGDFSVSYQINAHSKRPLYKDLIYSRLHQNIQDMFIEAGIEILSPNYMAQRDGNAVAIPKIKHKDKGHEKHHHKKDKK